METLRTLIVDDEPGMRLGVKKALARFTLALPDIDDQVVFACELAESGAQALSKMASFKPDILLLDYKLPDMTGLDLLERLPAADGECVTIMITAYASLETAVTAIKQGAFDFLAKPFTPDELKKTVGKAAHKLILERQVKKLALERRQVRFQFITVLGHELKSPLNAVEGYLNLMKTRAAGADFAAYDAMIERSLIRLFGMRKLITDLLDLTRIESGLKKRDIRETGLRAVAEKAVETAAPEAAARGVSIGLDADPALCMACDADEIEIMLNNLVSNAVKYNREGGTVKIGLARDGGKVLITVSDTGIGLSADETARLFSEFSRIKNEKTKNVIGSGLGLAILKKLASLYNGTVAVASRPGEGSTFTVTLFE
jgi:two-component system, sensor histidine kinase and response regulator